VFSRRQRKHSRGRFLIVARANGAAANCQSQAGVRGCWMPRLTLEGATRSELDFLRGMIAYNKEDTMFRMS
jgi:hypothetical protein